MNNVYYYKSPPQNYLIEELLLGLIILNPSWLTYINNMLEIESFCFESHQLIYRSILELSKNKKINLIALIYLLTSNKILNKIGGIKKIINLIEQSQLFSFSKNKSNYIEELINIVQNNYLKRLLIQYGSNIMKLGYLNILNTQKLHDKATKYLNCIYQDNKEENIDSFDELIHGFLSDNKHNKIFNKSTKKLSYGFQELDILLDGLSTGDLIVIAGRPSIGKTSFVINIAYHLINHCNVGTCIFSLEMSRVQILYKIISIASTIPIQTITSNKISHKQWNIIQKVCKQLLLSQFYINDKSNIYIEDIKNTSTLIKHNKPNIELIIIDYLQLIQLNNASYETRTLELSYITRALKILAKNLNIPIIILSQLNRNIEKRIDKKPLLSDLRESGCVYLKTLIQINPFNSINIINTIYTNHTISITTFPGYLINSNTFIINKLKYKAVILNQYIFKISNKLHITHGHKILAQKQWQKQQELLKNNYILHNNFDKNNFIENTIVSQITFTKFTNVYDIEMHQYTNFICKSIILHNSIEQDADIVMMISQAKNEQQIRHDEKILDIIIAKNRNGPTGSINLLFFPRNSIFNSVASV